MFDQTRPSRLPHFAILLHAAVVCSIVSSLLLAPPCAAQGSGSWNTLGPAGGGVVALLASPSDPSFLFAGTPHNGVFVSADGGTTWSAANTGLKTSALSGRRVELAIHALASDGRHVYAATDAGLFYADAGSTPAWTPLAPPTSTTPITLLAYEPLTARLFAASALTDG